MISIVSIVIYDSQQIFRNMFESMLSLWGKHNYCNCFGVFCFLFCGRYKYSLNLVVVCELIWYFGKLFPNNYDVHTFPLWHVVFFFVCFVTLTCMLFFFFFFRLNYCLFHWKDILEYFDLEYHWIYSVIKLVKPFPPFPRPDIWNCSS